MQTLLEKVTRKFHNKIPVQAPVDRTQQRLAQIEQSEEYTTKQTLQMNQKEWEKHIEKLHEDLITAWNGEERVKSLKIAIQATIYH